jgi:hypothetical protein
MFFAANKMYGKGLTDENFCSVPNRKMSNFLADDCEAVLKFMKAEKQKEKGFKL